MMTYSVMLILLSKIYHYQSGGLLNDGLKSIGILTILVLVICLIAHIFRPILTFIMYYVIGFFLILIPMAIFAGVLSLFLPLNLVLLIVGLVMMVILVPLAIKCTVEDPQMRGWPWHF